MKDNSEVIMQELVRRSNEDARRLRAVEQRIDAMESRINSFESANIDRVKKTNSRFAELDVSLRTINDQLLKIENNLDKINRQIAKFARKQDLKEIERMLDLISPIRQEFVTKGELKQEIEEEIESANASHRY
jgi:chromosome segregation ATPase